jgi:two-component system, cell cycle sensor histidine kinase and response regulator CckA
MSVLKNFNPKNRSLSSDLAISLIVIIIIVESAILGFIYSRQSRLLLKELNDKADDYAANISEVLAIPIWDFDDEQIVNIGAGFINKDLIEELHILDQQGQTLFLSKAENATEAFIERSVDISYNGQSMGTARLRFSLDPYKMELRWLRNAILFALSVSLVVILIASGFLLRIFMRKPLRILQTGINRVAKGEYEYGFEEIHHEELSGIATRFSDMAGEIKSREKSLHIVNRELNQEIADRKSAQEKIKQSEAKYRSILENMKEGYFEVDLKGIFVFINKAMLDLSGYSEEELIGMNFREIVDEKTADLVFNVFNMVFKTYLSEKVISFDAISKNREIRKVEISVSLIFNSDNEPMGFSGVARDITERIVAEIEKKKLEKRLQRSQKMEALGLLAGGVAHDLNNVLSGIVSYPELLLMDLPQDSPLRNPLLAIQNSGQKAADIVMDLLALARRGVPVKEIVNLNDIVLDYLNSPEYQKLATYHAGVCVQTRLQDKLLNIKGSSVHLRKSIMNLISNAAEAQPSGGEILISTYNRYVDTPIKGYEDIEEGDFVVLEVSDKGIGISDEDLNRIFEPFYTKKVMGRSGTGLGMAVVWGTIQDHHAYMNVESREGSGSSFYIYFPATREETEKDTTAIPIDTYLGKGQSILVVDDIQEQREVTQEILSKLNYSVTTMTSGEAAVEYMRDHSVDLMILDMIMDPGMDGLETYIQIIAIHPNQKAIIASGYSETHRVKEAQKLGAGEYIKKPYTMEKLGLAVHMELDRS